MPGPVLAREASTPRFWTRHSTNRVTHSRNRLAVRAHKQTTPDPSSNYTASLRSPWALEVASGAKGPANTRGQSACPSACWPTETKRPQIAEDSGKTIARNEATLSDRDRLLARRLVEKICEASGTCVSQRQATLLVSSDRGGVPGAP